ncbi:V protein [Mojiang virus]|uniref:Non-structural protein V n=1 Tax=Mojiang virus TaxID=1474807 RepID=W8TIR0_9MONO|nr:V protein [Mojiang virus]AHM23772.1 V protein [Mojiang virus]
MSYEDRIKQIQNGLQIVDLVKKVRQESIEKPTYGRSAIGLPTTKDRAAAWELFHKSSLDEAGPEELPLKEGDDPADTRDGVGIPEPLHNVDSGGSRTYKEANWDEGDEPILENQLVTNIQPNDPGRKTAYGKSDHTYADSTNNRTKGGEWSNGCSSPNKVDVSGIFQGDVPKDTDAEGPSEKPKSSFRMNPNAQEYIPRDLTPLTVIIDSCPFDHNHADDDSEDQTEDSAYVFEAGLNKPAVKPRMIKAAQKETLVDQDGEVMNLSILPKQRKSILNKPIGAEDAIPKKQARPSLVVIEEDDEDQKSEPIENIDKSDAGSDITIFDIADKATDHLRRNQMAVKAIGNIIETSAGVPIIQEEVIYLSDRPTQPAPEKIPAKESRKLRALEKTESGKGESDSGLRLVKKGHRREYSLCWDGSEIKVEEWCNPICSKVKSEPSREKCTCKQCPIMCQDEHCTKIEYE